MMLNGGGVIGSAWAESRTQHTHVMSYPSPSSDVIEDSRDRVSRPGKGRSTVPALGISPCPKFQGSNFAKIHHGLVYIALYLDVRALDAGGVTCVPKLGHGLRVGYVSK